MKGNAFGFHAEFAKDAPGTYHGASTEAEITWEVGLFRVDSDQKIYGVG